MIKINNNNNKQKYVYKKQVNHIYAKVSNIINNYSDISNVSTKDQILFRIGTDDKDPYVIFTLDKLRNCKQLRIQSNKYFNTGLLSYILNIIANTNKPKY